MIYGRKGKHAFCWGWSYETQSWTKLLGDKLCIFRWDLYLKFTKCWLIFWLQGNESHLGQLLSWSSQQKISSFDDAVVQWGFFSSSKNGNKPSHWTRSNLWQINLPFFDDNGCDNNVNRFTFELLSFSKTTTPSHILAAWSHVMWWNDLSWWTLCPWGPCQPHKTVPHVPPNSKPHQFPMKLWWLSSHKRGPPFLNAMNSTPPLSSCPGSWKKCYQVYNSMIPLGIQGF